MSKDKIIIKGAREHNLKNLDIEIPRDKLVVITGVSGSGKSSLAFDTIYAEGQRRYVESLSAYARQFLGQMQKPDVDSIEGLSPAIAIEQKSSGNNPRSTVGTITEIYDYLRLLFARVGQPHCPNCKIPIKSQTVQQITDRVLELAQGSKIMILAPVVKGRKGEYDKLLANIKKEGFLRVRVDGQVLAVEEKIKMDKNKKHNIEVVIDRLVIEKESKKRITDAVEIALKVGEGIVIINNSEKKSDTLFSEKLACPQCGFSMAKIEPRLFSFNNPFGACPVCTGLGTRVEVDERMVLDKSLSLRQGAIKPWSNTEGYYWHYLEGLSKKMKFSLETPFHKLPEYAKDALLNGTDMQVDFHYKAKTKENEYNYTGRFEGIFPFLQRRYMEMDTEATREDIYNKYMMESVCSACQGKRLKDEALAVTITGKSIFDITEFSVEKCKNFFEYLKLNEKETLIARQIIKEIKGRLEFLLNVGLAYLTLGRKAGTLSGGEFQRIHLANQIGVGLVGVLYILDEPSIGLHQRDNEKLLNTLKSLRDMGNTVIVVEHDEDTIISADHIIDMGPGPGVHGGEIVAQGTLKDILKVKNSLTTKYLNNTQSHSDKKMRRKHGLYLELKGAMKNNLKSIDVKFPLGNFICITGVSGSGKSSLIAETLYPALVYNIYKSGHKPTGYRELSGWEKFEKVVEIDQSPIGRTPRSNAATYTGVFTEIRKLFFMTKEAKARGYDMGRFSFNVKGGRCEACGGDGIVQIEMHFLPDVYVPCEVCNGVRYNRETLEVKYKGKNISEVLDMRVEEALSFFENIPSAKRILSTLDEVGMGYIKLGQAATTLSGGEAQRVKLASELSKRTGGNTIYILDEPTTGLHFADIDKLLLVLNRLVDMGNTVIVIEHNLDVINNSDYIIDLGPEGGDKGGYIVAEGSPEEVMKVAKSFTGSFLLKHKLRKEK
ncbi:MAG: excinuclease ABC subunit UvrA [bacterium]